MTSIRLPEELNNRLENLAALTHRPKSFYIREALSQYLEDLEDGYIALERLSRPKRKELSTTEVLQALE